MRPGRRGGRVRREAAGPGPSRGSIRRRQGPSRTMADRARRRRSDDPAAPRGPRSRPRRRRANGPGAPPCRRARRFGAPMRRRVARHRRGRPRHPRGQAGASRVRCGRTGSARPPAGSGRSPGRRHAARPSERRPGARGRSRPGRMVRDATPGGARQPPSPSRPRACARAPTPPSRQRSAARSVRGPGATPRARGVARGLRARACRRRRRRSARGGGHRPHREARRRRRGRPHQRSYVVTAARSRPIPWRSGPGKSGLPRSSSVADATSLPTPPARVAGGGAVDSACLVREEVISACASPSPRPP